MIPIRAAAALLMLSALPLGARADLVDVQWQADGSAQREFQVAPGKFAEWCTKLSKGESVKWEFESDAPLNFNVHFHEDKETRFPAKQDAATKAEGSLEVVSDQHYCWMWSNKSKSAVALRSTLRKHQ